MADPRTWTIDDVAARFEEAASTGRRLPPVRVQGYFNTWPIIVRKEWEAFAADEHVYRPFPPTPDAIERMLETMKWVQWLEVEQRHLVWMRAKRYGWRDQHILVVNAADERLDFIEREFVRRIGERLYGQGGARHG